MKVKWLLCVSFFEPSAQNIFVLVAYDRWSLRCDKFANVQWRVKKGKLCVEGLRPYITTPAPVIFFPNPCLTFF